MTRLEEAAIKLHKVIWQNTGNDDWPIQILLDDSIHDEAIGAFNELFDAVKEVQPDACPWPINTEELIL